MRAAVVLAGGKGTRFRSELAKVLHPVAGASMLRWVLEALRPLTLDRVVVVVGHQGDVVAAEAAAAGVPGLVTVTQHEQLGTGHAVRMAAEAGHLDGCRDVLVVPGDGPLLHSSDLAALIDERAGAGVVCLSAVVEDPTGYGRIVRDASGAVQAIVEEADADAATRAITEVGTSVYAFDGPGLVDVITSLSTQNAQGEEYLTDAVAALVPRGASARIAADTASTAGCNDRWQLAQAGAVLRRRIVTELARDGVTIEDPATTYVDAGVVVEPDAVLRPGVHLSGATHIAPGAVVGPDTRLVDVTVAAGAEVTYSVCTGVQIGPGALVGPFTHLRPGSVLDEGAKTGAFVEVKASHIGAGAKVPHLSYVGDADVGPGANVGAATVTVNYDGFAKHRTVIGAGAKVGSDTMLVAPVRVGDGAFTGAGSVITRDVPDGALAVERSEQRIITGYAERAAARKARPPTGSSAADPLPEATPDEGAS